MIASLARKAISLLACTAMAACGIPAAALAGENATVAEQEQNDAAIQEQIDGLQNLEEGKDYLADQILVTYSGESSPEAVAVDDDDTVADALVEAKDDDMVVAAQPNYVYQLMDSSAESQASSAEEVTNDPDASSQYYLDGETRRGRTTYRGANVREAWGLVKSNASVTVAVLDTGVQTTHEDLTANIDTTHMAMVTASGKVRVGAMKDEDGHGTHVAGIVSATANNEVGIAGTSYNATVLPIRVFENHTSTTLQCVAAIKYLDGLVESGQLTNLHVMNMSLGSYAAETSTDKLLRDKISHMRSEHDVISVCAGGNGIDGRPQTHKCFPADWSECVAVTSLTETGANSSWSDYNASKDISAPGELILSTMTDAYAKDLRDMRSDDLYAYKKNASYGFMEGTSMAAPLVSGIMALLWATYPQLSASDAVAAIKATAAETTLTFRPTVQDLYYAGGRGSAGLIDAAAAVTYVQQLAADRGDAVITQPQAHSIVSTVPSTVKGVKLNASGKSIKVSWKSVKGAAGYQVSYRQKGTSAWKTKTVKDALATTAKVTKLSSAKRYTVKVRAWRLKTSGSGKLYGAWSAVKTAKL